MESHKHHLVSKVPRSPHARVRVINVSDYDAKLKSKELKMSDDYCLTPKKKPAKTFFKKALKKDDKKSSTMTSPRTAKAIRAACGIKDRMPIPPSPNDEALSDFLNRVAKSQQSPKKPSPSSSPKKPSPTYSHQLEHQHHHVDAGMVPPPSPHSPPRTFAMLPEYARYQEARFHRTISRGNSFGGVSPKSPGVEWIDHRTGHQDVVWDANTLVAQHAFPSSIFCRPREEHSPMHAASMAAMHQEQYGSYQQHYHSSMHPAEAQLREMAFQDYMNRRSFHESGSIPTTTSISRGSSSSWSEDEEQRHFMEYMSHQNGHGPPSSPYAHQQHHQHHQQHTHPNRQIQRSASEESQESQSRLVEIAPGVHEPLRKADETVSAVRHDFYVPVCCFGCSDEIFCIADAKYVICPACRVVSPIEEGALEGQVLRQHGLGLGFNCESLFQIQKDLIQEHRC